jgi:alpha-tubulin suppressor-like RCC1 family protein
MPPGRRTIVRRSSTGAVTDSNRLASLYAWGWPDDGRLGLGPDLGVYIPSDPKADAHKGAIGLHPNPHPNFVFSSSTKDVAVRAAGGGRHSLFAMSDGRVTACGWNFHGQCGVPPDPDKTEYYNNTNYGLYAPVKVDGFKEEGREVFVKEVECGDATSYAITGPGKLYSWGKGKFGVLGIAVEDGEDPEQDEWKPRIVKTFSNISVLTISAGVHHCIALTVGNRVWTWGRNNHGQLGLTTNDDGQHKIEAPWVNTPTPIPFRKQEKIMKVVAGHYHNVALLEITRPDMREEITIFSWGCPDDSRLGDCNAVMSHVPQEVHSVTIMAKKMHWVFSDVAAGGAHTLVLEKYNGLVLAFGQGKYGQLGYGDVWDRPDPVMVIGLRHVTNLVAGSRHSMALVDRVASNDSTDGEVYAWGYNNYGECGLGDCSVRLQPHKINGLINADVQFIAAGFKHSMCITKGLAKKVRDLPEYQQYLELLKSEGMLVYDAIKKKMETEGLNPDYLDTPDKILPGQPGIENKPALFEGAEPGMQYCIDTLLSPDTNEIIMKQRGTYETTYNCVRCKFHHVCLACARHCHGLHPVRVNFKMRQYGDTCVCCKHDICNIRWSHIRHEFDKLALNNEDHMISIDEIPDVLHGLRDDIEERRGGLPLTTKQKEDDLKACIDAMVEARKMAMEEKAASGSIRDQMEAQKKREEAEELAKAKKRDKLERERERAEAAKKKRQAGQSVDPDEGEESEEEEPLRVHFKDFERWYLEYFTEEDLAAEDEDDDDGAKNKGKKAIENA